MKAKFFLLLIFIFMVAIKISGIYAKEYFNVRDDTGLLWTESALQQRSAEKIAFHGRLPILDKKAQYPEGLDYKHRLTVVMETTTGYIYRLFIPKNVPFHVYLVIFIGIWSSLCVFPLYYAINYLFQNKNIALFGTLFYAVTPAVYITVTAPSFELQDFTLPLIFSHLYFFARAMKARNSKGFSYAMLSGAFLFASLASWHLTQFYYTLFVVFIAGCTLFMKDFDLIPFYIITIFGVVAGLSIPVLRTAEFIFSFAMLMSYAVVFASIPVIRKTGARKIALLILSGIAVYITWYIAASKIPEYRYVYGLIIDKIRFLGVRPSDPTSLPWETLVMWVSPFTSPSMRSIALSLGTISLAGIIGLIIGLLKNALKKNNLPVLLYAYCTIIFLPLYLILVRLDVFLVWFLALQSGYIFNCRRKIVRIALFLSLIINSILLFNQPVKNIGPDQNYLLGIIKYFRNHTPENAPVLTSFAFGPSLLTYAQRPILLHPKFEATDMTTKIKIFEHSLFGPEENFYLYCQQYGAKYFLYQADMLLARGPESIRFRTHNLKINKECISYQLHFQPESLHYFEQVYANPHYKIFRVLDRGEEGHFGFNDYFRIYDEMIIDTRNLGINPGNMP